MEINPSSGKPGAIYNDLTKQFGEPFYDRIQAKATPEQKEKLKQRRLRK